MRVRMNQTAKVIMVGLLLTAASVAETLASQVKLDLSLAHPVVPAGQRHVTYVKVGLTGFEWESARKRTPANVAIVIDKSGSMQGEKIRRAREAAMMVLDRLRVDDIVSIVAYDNGVSVLVPATKVSDREAIRDGIRRIEAGGSTALFAGVSKGAAEVRKFLDRNRVNRVILLSDGLANVGPDTPGALGELGGSLIKEGVSVTTIGLGLGFNEDLMTELARRSDGNNYFAEGGKDLARVFNLEFGDVLSVVAQEVKITIECEPGVRPVRVLGREAEISGQRVTCRINQVYSGQEKYVLLEVEVPADEPRAMRNVAAVSVGYANMDTRTKDHLESRVAARYSDSEEEIKAHVDSDVMVSAVTQIATERNRYAVALRDQGKVEEARRVLVGNEGYLSTNAVRFKSQQLRDYAAANGKDADNLDEGNWQRQRKSMRNWDLYNSMQQSAK